MYTYILITLFAVFQHTLITYRKIARIAVEDVPIYYGSVMKKTVSFSFYKFFVCIC